MYNITGIIGNKDCTWMEDWTAYKCTTDYNYEMLLIESMDSDTETRRLSPVAILGEFLGSLSILLFLVK